MWMGQSQKQSDMNLKKVNWMMNNKPRPNSNHQQYMQYDSKFDWFDILEHFQQPNYQNQSFRAPSHSNNQSIDISRMPTDQNQFYMRTMNRPSLDMSMTHPEMMDTSIQQMNSTMPKLSMPTPTFKEKPRNQYADYMNNTSARNHHRIAKKPANYNTNISKAVMTPSQMSRNVIQSMGTADSRFAPEPSTYRNLPRSNMQMAQFARSDRLNRESFTNASFQSYNMMQNESFSQMPPPSMEMENNTLRQSLSLIKMATKMNKRQMPSRAYLGQIEQNQQQAAMQRSFHVMPQPDDMKMSYFNESQMFKGRMSVSNNQTPTLDHGNVPSKYKNQFFIEDV